MYIYTCTYMGNEHTHICTYIWVMSIPIYVHTCITHGPKQLHNYKQCPVQTCSDIPIVLILIVFVSLKIYLYIHVQIYMYIYTCTCIYVHVYMYIYIYTCTYIHVHVYIYMYMYRYTHNICMVTNSVLCRINRYA